MKILMFVALVLVSSIGIFAQDTQPEKKKWFSGMYLQWGYNTEWYTHSTIHFKGAVDKVSHDFKVFDAVAQDKPGFHAIWESPWKMSVPQYNYRVGFYLNKAKTKAIEINFDHTKYVMNDDQTLHVQGHIGDHYLDKDTLITNPDFIHFEHTNGANFYLFNYVQFWPLNNHHKSKFYFVPMVKAGAGFMVPKTDVTLFGKRLDNKFHLAGYMAGLETGSKFYFAKKLFVEASAKTGFCNYTNALTVDGGKAQHSFAFFEVIGSVGWDINFYKHNL
ncbi:MAG TPA: hypothetical protein VLC98_05555 [Phnomibacter sp.]|nr:hypothetical protein [Phnomibacter sp.]